MDNHIEVRWDGEKYVAKLYDHNGNHLSGNIRTCGEGQYPENAVGDLIVYGNVEQFTGLRVDIYERELYYSRETGA